MKQIFFLFSIVIVLVTSCSEDASFSKSDLNIIRTNPEQLLKIYTIESESETLVLRKSSSDLSQRGLRSDEFAILAERMIATVSDTLVGGVGLAAPQVGINKNIVVVQRFDKSGEPFEVYPNISIIEYSDEKTKGPEGCLSVPGERYDVERSASIKITYFDIETNTMVEEEINGFTSIIFQHEVDHLNGIIYTDRVLM